jgi:plastocyanin
MSDITRARRAAALLVPLLAPALLVGAVAAEPATARHHAASVHVPAEHVVRMVVTDGAYRFEPAEISASPGDRITFVNESGGPHNVAFDASRIDDALEA